MIWLRATGDTCTIVGLGNRETGVCRIRFADGRVIGPVHYSDLCGDRGEIVIAFYGEAVPGHSRSARNRRRRVQAK